MGKISVNQFLGIAPKLGTTLLPPTFSQKARNARLWSQTLRPIDGRANPAVLSKLSGEIQSIWPYDDNTGFLVWTQDVDVVRTPIAGDTLEKIYFTGTDKPRVTTKDLYGAGSPGTSLPPASYILGLPNPSAAPVATLGAAGLITATSTWVFTFVRKWSDGTVDEGGPSVPSNSITTSTQQVSITLPNGTLTTPSDYGITHKRLYRNDGSLYFFVGETTISSSPYADNLATASLGSEITTISYLPPPDGMIGITELANGVVAGFSGNTVYLSEPYRPWAFPLVNQYAVSWPIVAIGGFGTTVAVATNAYPYIGRGLDPAAYAFKPQVGAQYPCLSKRSLAMGELGVFWATTDGIALANESGVTLITKDILTRKEWLRDFAPETMHGIVHETRYYAWYSKGNTIETSISYPLGVAVKFGGGLILDKAEAAVLTELGEYVDAAEVKPDTGQLVVVKKNTTLDNYAWEFNRDPSLPTQYEWKSKVFIAPGRDNFSHAQIIADFGAGLTDAEIADLATLIASIQAFNASLTETDGELNAAELNVTPINGDTYLLIAPSEDYISGAVTFLYWADGKLRLSRTVNSQEPFPLPSGFTAEKHEFSLSGEVEVSEATLATSVEELAR